MRRIAKFAQFVILAAALILLSACNLPQNAPPAATAPQPSDTPFTLATPPAATATRPAVTIITATPGPPAATAGRPATAPAAATEAVTQPGTYPGTPNGVVLAFVDAYPDDTNGMLQYLSASLKSSLPQGGPGALLNVPGDVNGFVILSGSAVPQPPQAQIQAAFQMGAQQAMRTFDLVQENGRWVINSIQ